MPLRAASTSAPTHSNTCNWCWQQALRLGRVPAAACGRPLVITSLQGGNTQLHLSWPAIVSSSPRWHAPPGCACFPSSHSFWRHRVAAQQGAVNVHVHKNSSPRSYACGFARASARTLTVSARQPVALVSAGWHCVAASGPLLTACLDCAGCWNARCTVSTHQKPLHM